MEQVTDWHRNIASGVASIRKGGALPLTARFTVIERCGQFFVHDEEDGSNTLPLRRSSAVHLAQQWNRQAAQEAK
jgi:hypothetical protein